MRMIIVFLCYLAAAIFLGCLVFGQTLGDTNLLADGLFCIAVGLALGSAPIEQVEARRRQP